MWNTSSIHTSTKRKFRSSDKLPYVIELGVNSTMQGQRMNDDADHEPRVRNSALLTQKQAQNALTTKIYRKL